MEFRPCELHYPQLVQCYTQHEADTLSAHKPNSIPFVSSNQSPFLALRILASGCVNSRSGIEFNASRPWSAADMSTLMFMCMVSGTVAGPYMYIRVGKWRTGGGRRGRSRSDNSERQQFGNLGRHIQLRLGSFSFDEQGGHHVEFIETDHLSPTLEGLTALSSTPSIQAVCIGTAFIRHGA
jgi:hypothetical protein